MLLLNQRKELLAWTALCFIVGLVAAASKDSDLKTAAATAYSHQVIHSSPGILGQHPLVSHYSGGLQPLIYPADNSLGGPPQHPLLSLAHTPPPTPPQVCPEVPLGPCINSKYRTIDGSCNNLKNPRWGTPNTRYARLLAPKYSDGVHAPPVSVTGHKLPGSRLVSIVLFPDVPIPDPVWTLNSMQWGQIITHDMSMAMGTTQAKAHSIQCCSPDGRLQIPPEYANSYCFPILIPEDDPVYSKFNQMCMNFVRSTTDLDAGCSTGIHPAEQLVTVTHYMDASLVYGSNAELAARLREGVGGRLIVEFKDGRPFPPPAQNKTATCDIQSDDEPCYQFGDVRANQNPQLTVLQITLLREHNRIATALEHLNPHWDDETLYQEARRILIAEYQHINYYEWLPIFIGTDNMVKYGLLYPKAHGYIEDYKEEVDPSTIQGHATAAFRYFHSAIQGKLQLISEHRQSYGALRLSDYFNRPGVIEQGDNYDNLARGLNTQSQETVDPFFTSEITDFLFRNGKPFGRDLRATDIQRGRDHGLASYNDFRHFCGLPKASKFEDFGDYISPENIEKLSLLYAHPDDVDLVVGGSLEAHVDKTLSGPTFLCLLLEQFYRTRVGDRFFFERGHSNPSSFTPEQLNEIRKSSVSRILCDNGDNIYSMQPKGFEVISHSNPLVSCEDTHSIPAIDLSLWKEIPTHAVHEYFKK
ncbi:peroxidase-like [Lycorma delicatula]|uniref:peroxidase-like n=1 Tax=Lycorma delicatula TaxID=130591 RepID=UPI003F517CEE